MTMYEMAKQIVESKEPMSDKQIKQELKKIAKNMRVNPCDTYLMICPDLRQYLVFQVNEEPETNIILDTLEEVLLNRGTILDIDSTAADQEIWEIWIRDIFDDKVYMYQLTNYTSNVIDIG